MRTSESDLLAILNFISTMSEMRPIGWDFGRLMSCTGMSSTFSCFTTFGVFLFPPRSRALGRLNWVVLISSFGWLSLFLDRLKRYEVTGRSFLHLDLQLSVYILFGCGRFLCCGARSERGIVGMARLTWYTKVGIVEYHGEQVDLLNPCHTETRDKVFVRVIHVITDVCERDAALRSSLLSLMPRGQVGWHSHA